MIKILLVGGLLITRLNNKTTPEAVPAQSSLHFKSLFST